MQTQMITPGDQAAGPADEACPRRATSTGRNGRLSAWIGAGMGFWVFFLSVGCVQPVAPSACRGVVYEPRNLGRWLTVGEAWREREGGSRRLRVRVPLVNTAPEPLKLRMRIQFLDGNANSHGDDTALRCLVIPAHAATWMEATSHDASACYYRVWVEWIEKKP